MKVDRVLWAFLAGAVAIAVTNLDASRDADENPSRYRLALEVCEPALTQCRAALDRAIDLVRECRQ